MSHNPQLHIAVCNAMQILEKLKKHIAEGKCQGRIIKPIVAIDPLCDACMVLCDEFEIAKCRVLTLTEEAERGDCATCG